MYPRINAYACEKCGHATITTESIQGVTPFMIRCRSPKGCQASAFSAFYRVNPLLGVMATHEWYRPSAEELSQADQAIRDHVAKGGLLLRPIGGTCSIREAAD